MKVLFAAVPLAGHLNPLLGTIRLLVQAGHQVGVYTGSTMRELVERNGAEFFPFPPDIDIDMRNMDEAFPERSRHVPGIERMIHDYSTFLIGPMRSQYLGLLGHQSKFGAEVIVYEHLFYGAIPMSFLSPDVRPVLIGCGITFLNTPRLDGAPHGLAFPFATDAPTRVRYRSEVMPATVAALAPLHALYRESLQSFGIEDHITNFKDASTLRADYFWQSTIPSFDYPQGECGVDIRFMGVLPQIPSTTAIPPWENDLADYKKVVLVTQGTVANNDFDELIGPTLSALADEPETLVIATAGGRDAGSVSSSIPSNCRVANYLPFDWLMPKIDLLITNGGYGTVNQAMAAGVPMIVAGASEDKPEVAARIAWSGAGIRLNATTPDDIKAAFRRIFADNTFTDRAAELASEFRMFDSANLILENLETAIAVRKARAVSRLWKSESADMLDARFV